MKFARDRRRCTGWLFEAKKRYGLCVLNYIVTSNHFHLLVYDTGAPRIIPKSLQLIAGRTAQEYNQRKGRKGAFWEDRYHATAVASDNHLAECLTYIDLNMVRAGVVEDPSDWECSGYHESLLQRQRYRIIDSERLMHLLGMEDERTMAEHRQRWIQAKIQEGNLVRETIWSQGVAVGGEAYLKEIQTQVGRV
ncbi:hypothetical protein DSLASN_11950 [Desulfoluna limicola]|uniref:Transposase IS200-like domain-containing protein n=1 Tax=Desulfoluna limicola TaxID=2810562 RepID=A0ABN6F194_9BACT|nr:hypothetical protein DSLASN_11950 [Desulfoluna limicola]